MQELIDYAKAHPGKLAYGSAGVEAITHVTVERFRQRASGLACCMCRIKAWRRRSAIMSGDQRGVPQHHRAGDRPHRSGKLRILAVNAPARLPAIADIPTAIEAGLPDFVSQTFFGIFAPAATARPVLQTINAATQTEWGDQQFQRKLMDAGFEPMLGYGPAQAARYLEQEFARWSPVVQSLGTQNQ